MIRIKANRRGMAKNESAVLCIMSEKQFFENKGKNPLDKRG